MEVESWIVGKENILKFSREKFNFHSWQSVRYWRKKYKFPVRYLPNGVPFFIVEEVIDWSIEFDRIRSQSK